jgi:hypothetical protein
MAVAPCMTEDTRVDWTGRARQTNPQRYVLHHAGQEGASEKHPCAARWQRGISAPFEHRIRFFPLIQETAERYCLL